jgi:hypothetical protein
VILSVAGVLWEMKTFIHRRNLVAGLIAIVCSAALPASSQSEANPPTFEIRIEQGRLINYEGHKDSWAVKDASLSNVVSYLQSVNPGANIVMAADAGQIKIGDLQLSGVTIDLALHALCIASGDQVVFDNINRGAGPSGTLFILKKKLPVSPPPSSDASVMAFNLTGYFNYLTGYAQSQQAVSTSGQASTPEQMQAKIDEALMKLKEIITGTVLGLQRLSSSSVPPPIVSYYKDANLLVVTGSPDALATARKIVNALPGEVIDTGARFQAPQTMQK